MSRLFLVSIALVVLPAFGQPGLHLKTRTIKPSANAAVDLVDTPVWFGPGHLILQFSAPPTADQLQALSAAGISVLGDIPEHGVLVALSQPVAVSNLGIVYASPLNASDKISPLIASADDGTGGGYFLVEFHPDVNLNDARALVQTFGVELRENPDLGAHRLMIRIADAEQALMTLTAMATADPVAYIFPASDELAAGIPSRPCAGALSSLGIVGQFIATNGPGWSGSNQSGATVGYMFSSLTNKLAAAQARAEIERALNEWSKVVQVTWQPASDATAPGTVNILFASGSHGDAYPFDGPGGVLAHTFYPSPPNPEPIAGDMHFDASEPWNIGANTDLFSVALHEAGHALGLGHSDSPTDVMYPYYKMASSLSAGDKTAILSLYAAAPSGTPNPNPPVTPEPNPSPAPSPAPTPPTPSPTPNPPPPPNPAPPSNPAGNDTAAPSLKITSPAGTSVSTTSSSVTFSGTASDNTAVASVTWSTNTGSSGTAVGTTQWTATIPVLVGSNTVTIRATDPAGNVGWRTVVVSRH